MDVGEKMIENVDGTKMIRSVENVVFVTWVVGLDSNRFGGLFGLTFLVNLLLNVNMLLTSPTWQTFVMNGN